MPPIRTILSTVAWLAVCDHQAACPASDPSNTGSALTRRLNGILARPVPQAAAPDLRRIYRATRAIITLQEPA